MSFTVETDTLDPQHELLHDAAARHQRREVWRDAPPVYQETGLVLVEAASLWDEAKHPRWPKGSKDPVTGKPIAGRFMEIGQQFMHDGKKYEIAFFGPKDSGVVWAHRAGGGKDVGLVEFHVAQSGGGDTGASPTIPGASMAEPVAFNKHGSHPYWDPNFLTVDAYVDASTHDPSLALPKLPGMKVTQSDWEKFGRADQMNFLRLAQEFGQYSPSQNSALVKQLLSKVDSHARNDLFAAYSGQHYSSTGMHFNFAGFVSGIGEKMHLVDAQARREKAKQALREASAVVQWDLYNRVRGADVTIMHRSGDSPGWWNGTFKGTGTPVISGLSTSWKYGVWSGDTIVVTPMAIRNIVMAQASVKVKDSYPGAGHEGYTGEHEIATADQWAMDDRTQVISEHKQLASAGMKQWLAQATTQSPASGDVARQLAAYILKEPDKWELNEPPNISMDGSDAQKLWVDPPSDIGKEIYTDQAGHPFEAPKTVGQLGYAQKDASGEPIAKPANELNLKAGDLIEGMAGSRYVVIDDPGDPYGFYYRRAELSPDGSWMGPQKTFSFSGGGQKPFKLLDGHVTVPKPKVEEQEGPLWDQDAWLNGVDKVQASLLSQGQIFKVNDIPYMAMGMVGTQTKVKNLETGKLGSINPAYKATPLVPKEGYVAIDTSAHQKPEVGVTFAYDGEKYEITVLLKSGQVQAKRYNKPGVVKLNPDDPALAPENLHSPASYSIDDKPVKLQSLQPGEKFQGGTGSITQKPFVVLEQQGKETLVKNLDTGAVGAVKASTKYRRLLPKTAEVEPESPMQADQHLPSNWQVGAHETLGALFVGDKFVFEDPATGKPIPEYQAEAQGSAEGVAGFVKVKLLTGPQAGQLFTVAEGTAAFRLEPHEGAQGPITPWTPSAYVDGPVASIDDMGEGQVFLGKGGTPYVLKKKGPKSGAVATNLLTGKPYPAIPYEKTFLTQVAKKSTVTPYSKLKPGNYTALKSLQPGDQFEGDGGSIYEVTKNDPTKDGPSFFEWTPFGAGSEVNAPMDMQVKFHAFAGQGYNPFKVPPPDPLQAGVQPVDTTTDVSGLASAKDAGFKPFTKAVLGQQVGYAALSELPAGAPFKGKADKLFFVKQQGKTAIVSDGVQNYWLDGNSVVLSELDEQQKTIATVLKSADQSPPLGDTAKSSEKATAIEALKPNPPGTGYSMGDLDVGDWVKVQEDGGIGKVISKPQPFGGVGVVDVQFAGPGGTVSFFTDQIPAYVAKLAQPATPSEFNSNDYVADLKLAKVSDLVPGDVAVLGNGNVVQLTAWSEGGHYADAKYLEGGSGGSVSLSGDESVTKMIPKTPPLEFKPVFKPPTSDDYVPTLAGNLEPNDVFADDNGTLYKVISKDEFEVHADVEQPGPGLGDKVAGLKSVPFSNAEMVHKMESWGPELYDPPIELNQWEQVDQTLWQLKLKPGDKFTDLSGDGVFEVLDNSSGAHGPLADGDVYAKIVVPLQGQTNAGVTSHFSKSFSVGAVAKADAKAEAPQVTAPSTPPPNLDQNSFAPWMWTPGPTLKIHKDGIEQLPPGTVFKSVGTGGWFQVIGPHQLPSGYTTVEARKLGSEHKTLGTFAPVAGAKPTFFNVLNELQVFYPPNQPGQELKAPEGAFNPGDYAEQMFGTLEDLKKAGLVKPGTILHSASGGAWWKVEKAGVGGGALGKKFGEGDKDDPSVFYPLDPGHEVYPLSLALGAVFRVMVPKGSEVAPADDQGLPTYKGGEIVYFKSNKGGPVWVVQEPSGAQKSKPGGPSILSLVDSDGNQTKIGKGNVKKLDTEQPLPGQPVKPSQLQAGMVFYLPNTGGSMYVNSVTHDDDGGVMRVTNMDDLTPQTAGPLEGIPMPGVTDAVYDANNMKWVVQMQAVAGDTHAKYLAAKKSVAPKLTPEQLGPVPGPKPGLGPKIPAGLGKPVLNPSGPTTDDGTVMLTGKGAGGTTGAQWGLDAAGLKVLVKTYGGNEDRVATEWLANQVYQAVGAHVPEGTLKTIDGKMAYVYKALDGVPGSQALKVKKPNAQLGKFFMADALLANYDFVGYDHDNLLWPEGTTQADIDSGKVTPARIDQGGTFFFRAQGKLKDYYPDDVPEVKTMLSVGQGKGTVAVTDAEKQQQAADIAAKLTPQTIDELVDAAPFKDQGMREDVRKALKGRVAWMFDYSGGVDSAPPVVEPPADTGSVDSLMVKKAEAVANLQPIQFGTLEDLDVGPGDWVVVNGKLSMVTNVDAFGDVVVYDPATKTEDTYPGFWEPEKAWLHEKPLEEEEPPPEPPNDNFFDGKLVSVGEVNVGDQFAFPWGQLKLTVTSKSGNHIGYSFTDDKGVKHDLETEDLTQDAFLVREAPAKQTVANGGHTFRQGSPVAVWAPLWDEPKHGTVKEIFPNGLVAIDADGATEPLVVEPKWLQPPTPTQPPHLPFEKGGKATFTAKNGQKMVGRITYVDPATGVSDVKVGVHTMQVEDKQMIQYLPPGWTPAVGDFVLPSDLNPGDVIEVLSKKAPTKYAVGAKTAAGYGKPGQFVLTLHLVGTPKPGQQETMSWTGSDSAVANGALPGQPSPWKLVSPGEPPDDGEVEKPVIGTALPDGWVMAPDTKASSLEVGDQAAVLNPAESPSGVKGAVWEVTKTTGAVVNLKVVQAPPDLPDSLGKEVSVSGPTIFHFVKPYAAFGPTKPTLPKGVIPLLPTQKQLDEVIAKYGSVDGIPMHTEPGYGSEYGTGGKIRYRTLEWVPTGDTFHLKQGGLWQKLATLAEGIVIVNTVTGEGRMVQGSKLRVKPPAGLTWKHDAKS